MRGSNPLIQSQPDLFQTSKRLSKQTVSHVRAGSSSQMSLACYRKVSSTVSALSRLLKFEGSGGRLHSFTDAPARQTKKYGSSPQRTNKPQCGVETSEILLMSRWLIISCYKEKSKMKEISAHPAAVLPISSSETHLLLSFCI